MGIPQRIGVLLATVVLGLVPAAGQSWIQKVAGSGLGNPLTSNPLNSDVLYGAAGGDKIYISRDRGYTWAVHDTIPGGGIIKSLTINPLDTLDILAGMETGGAAFDRIMKTTNGGASWTQTWGGTMSYYGAPVEFNAAHPDTVYTMGLDTLFRSIDFGSTWDTVTIGAGFNAWCDAALRPDSANIMYIGDNLSGIWKTTNHGETWVKKYSTFGEIPSIAIDPLNPAVAYASKFGAGGGFLKSTDWGETWQWLPVPSGNRDTWWTTCSPEHPGYVYYGTYTGDTAALGLYMSRDAGANWTKIFTGIPPAAIFNYGLYTLDSLTLIALQQTGIFKYQYPTSIELLSPAGGEHFVKDSVHTVSWSSAGLYYVDIDFSADGGANWSPVADSIPVSQTSYDWTVPDLVSDSCLLRISDALFTSTVGASDSFFTITNAFLTVFRPDGGETLHVESFEEILWSSVSLDSVRIEFSPDSGETWNFIAVVPAAVGIFNWYVPRTLTGEALIRITGIDDSTIVDQSDGVFSITSLKTFLAGLMVEDIASGSDTLMFGNLIGASDDIDTAFGEWELSQAPGPGEFDARWLLDGSNGLAIDVRDTLGPEDPLFTYTASLQVGINGKPLGITWHPDELENGTFIWTYRAGSGVTFKGNMRRDSAVVVNSDTVDFTVLQCPTKEVVVPADGGWKLVSVPVETGNNEYSSLFPYSKSDAFAYKGGYVSAETLAFGSGYWIKTFQAILAGCALGPETVAVAAGWNLVGAPSVPVPVSAVVSVPDSILLSLFYGYDGSGYYTADSLVPGEGYWVKTSSAGTLVIPDDPSPALASGSAAGPRAAAVRASRLTVRRTAGERGQALLFGPRDPAQAGNAPGGAAHGAPSPSASWELPPPPPSGAGNVGFAGNSAAFFFDPAVGGSADSCEVELIVPAAGSRLYLDWDIDIEDKFTYILTQRADNRIVSTTRLEGRSRIVLPAGSASRFYLTANPSEAGQASEIREFRLGEFYPNPFNPETRVLYSLPARSHVTVRIYSVAGEEVARPLDGEVDKGEHSFIWDGTADGGAPVASGVYFISMQAVQVVQTAPGAGSRGPEPAGGTGHAVRKVVFLR